MTVRTSYVAATQLLKYSRPGVSRTQEGRDLSGLRSGVSMIEPENGGIRLSAIDAGVFFEIAAELCEGLASSSFPTRLCSRSCLFAIPGVPLRADLPMAAPTGARSPVRARRVPRKLDQLEEIPTAPTSFSDSADPTEYRGPPAKLIPKCWPGNGRFGPALLPREPPVGLEPTTPSLRVTCSTS